MAACDVYLSPATEHMLELIKDILISSFGVIREAIIVFRLLLFLLCTRLLLIVSRVHRLIHFLLDCREGVVEIFLLLVQVLRHVDLQRDYVITHHVLVRREVAYTLGITKSRVEIINHQRGGLPSYESSNLYLLAVNCACMHFHFTIAFQCLHFYLCTEHRLGGGGRIRKTIYRLCLSVCLPACLLHLFIPLIE